MTNGKPARSTPMPHWPYFDDDDVAAAAEVLRSGRVNQWTGGCVKAFEKAFAAYCDRPYAVAVQNGTNALEVALEAMGIGAGDEVIVTPRTFVASASAIIRVGATPIFADVERESGNISAATIAPALTSKSRAIMCVHLAGWPCDMDPILDLAKAHKLRVLEDAAQAHGAKYKGKTVGELGDMAAFSFCQDKILTTAGEGGMILTANEELYRRAWSIKDHGKSYESVFEKQHPPGFRWLHDDFGSNYRMTEIQAAVGLSTLEKLPRWLEIRRAHAQVLNDVLAGFDGIRVTLPPDDVEHAYYKLYAYVRPECLAEGWTRDRIIAEINDLGIPCFSGSCSEIYLEKAFAKHNLRPEKRLPIAAELGDTSLMFLVHPTLKTDDVADTADAIHRVLAQALR
ncbi:MAG: DegT/DnrJ/EryC1/StrS family aminotransferase [Deltaproteobacteria bacterium]|nr:DegT/DnrJ/EryC1/StrS family aminotransferase [Deltaproteobacteria bacterium]